jgi:hypothetical protein
LGGGLREGVAEGKEVNQEEKTRDNAETQRTQRFIEKKENK